jgi:phosphatidylglycerol lysyltransferase
MAKLRSSICLLSLFILAQSSPSIADEPMASKNDIALKRGGFQTYDFIPAGVPHALIVFGSGDGGWGYVENRTCTFLKESGYYVIGIDCRNYASTDYDAATLIDDYRSIVDEGSKHIGSPERPVIYGGWSMGAVQAVAATGSDRRPQHLVGLLLLSMDARGRYGLRLTDEINISPVGDETFGVADFTAAVSNLRVVQFEAIGDWMSNSDWTKTLKTPHRLYEIDHSNHDFNGVDQNFENELLGALNWILDPANPPGDDPRGTG